MSKKKELLPVTVRATNALAMQDRETELTTLAGATTDITAITNADGYKQVRAGRLALRSVRLEIQNAGKQAREDATAFSKAVIAEEKRLVGLIEPEEKRLEALEVAEDERMAAEKQAEIDREIARQSALQERIAELRGCQMLSATSGSALIAEHIADLESIAVDESFEELLQQARDTKLAGLAWLREVHAAAVGHELAQEKLRADLAELERLRTEAAARAAADAERERAAKVERDAEAARHTAQLKQQTEDAEREQAARQKIIDESNARIAADQKAAQDKLDAEAKRQADAAIEIVRQQEELRKAQEPAPASIPTPVREYGIVGAVADGAQVEVTITGGSERASVMWTVEAPSATEPVAIPSREQIVAALCDDFLLDEVQILAVLSRIDWQEALAEAA